MYVYVFLSMYDCMYTPWISFEIIRKPQQFWWFQRKWELINALKLAQYQKQNLAAIPKTHVLMYFAIWFLKNLELKIRNDPKSGKNVE